MKPKIEFAYSLAKMGFNVFPVYGITKNRECQCGNSVCNAKGKHPIISGWQKRATSDLEKIQKLWTTYPEANIGLVLPEDIFVIDVDPKNNGDISLQNFETKYGKLVGYAEVKTGSGGNHLFFKVPPSLKTIKLRNKPILEGIDLKCSGGFVVGIGSNHISGNNYSEGKAGFNIDLITELNHNALIEIIKTKCTPVKKINASSELKGVNNLTPVPFNEKTREVTEGGRNQFLFTVASSLRARNVAPKLIFDSIMSINQKVCTPPLEEKEVFQIAHGVIRYPPNFKKEAIEVDLDSKIFSNPIGDLIKSVHRDTEASPIAIFIQILTILSCVVGRKVKIKHGAIDLPLNMFTIIVGPTSKGRKGTSLNVAFDVLKQIGFPGDLFQRENGFGSGEALTVSLVESELSKKPLLYTEPEAAKLFKVSKRDGNTLSPNLRDAYDASPVSNNVKKKKITATDYHISLIGHITPFEINKEITTTDIENGLGNRCMWFYSERKHLLPRGGNDWYLLDFDYIFENINGFTEKEISLSSEALDYWDSLYVDISSNENLDDKIAALGARATDHILKISALISISKGEKKISTDSLVSAELTWRYSNASAEFIFSTKRRESQQTKSDALLLKLSEDGPMTRTQIRDFYSKNLNFEQIEEIKLELISKEAIEVSFESAKEIWAIKSK